jgi:hypothetical protein
MTLLSGYGFYASEQAGYKLIAYIDERAFSESTLINLIHQKKLPYRNPSRKEQK